MQQTAFDRWLKVRFVYTYAVNCNTLPSERPVSSEVVIYDSPSRWAYRVNCSSEAEFEAISAQCRFERIAYAPLVVRKSGWWVGLLDAPDSSSFTYRVAWHMLRLCTIGVLLSWSGLGAVFGLLSKVEGAVWLNRAISLLRGMLSWRPAVMACILGVTMNVYGGNDPDLTLASDDVALPTEEGAIIAPVASELSLPATSFMVVKRCGISPAGSTDIPTTPGEQWALNVWPDRIELISGKNHLYFEVHDAKAKVQDAKHPDRGLVPAIKGFRVAVGGGIEQLVITERTLMMIVPSAATNSVVVTYAEALSAPTLSANR